MPAALLEKVMVSNREFRDAIALSDLPVARRPAEFGLITCMDPRVNLAALGIEPFDDNGSLTSDVRVIRTVGGRAEERSLLVGIHLAGIMEWIILTHTDCGAIAAWKNTELLARNLKQKCEEDNAAVREWTCDIDDLRKRLLLFPDARAAAVDEVTRVRSFPFVPESVVVHGLCYDLSTGAIEVVVDGGT